MCVLLILDYINNDFDNSYDLKFQVTFQVTLFMKSSLKILNPTNILISNKRANQYSNVVNLWYLSEMLVLFCTIRYFLLSALTTFLSSLVLFLRLYFLIIIHSSLFPIFYYHILTIISPKLFAIAACFLLNYMLE